MNQKEFCKTISSLVRVIRTEYGFTQDQMALILGISKKTLVETEKKRRELSWTEAAAFVSIFSQSAILQNELGGEAGDMLRAIAFADHKITYPRTMGGKVWWRNVEEKGGLRIQQNIISQHYRLLDSNDGRIMSSFSLNDIQEYIKENYHG